MATTELRGLCVEYAESLPLEGRRRQMALLRHGCSCANVADMQECGVWALGVKWRCVVRDEPKCRKDGEAREG